MDSFLKLCIFFVISFCCCLPFVQCDFETGRPIQIAVPVNNTIKLQTNQLKSILENDFIKDRNVVVVSIAGAFHQGKGFLLNFFLKYLYAQVRFNSMKSIFVGF